MNLNNFSIDKINFEMVEYLGGDVSLILNRIENNAKINFRLLSEVTGFEPPVIGHIFSNIDDFMRLVKYFIDVNLDLGDERIIRSNSGVGKHGVAIERSLTGKGSNRNPKRDAYAAEIKSQVMRTDKYGHYNFIKGNRGLFKIGTIPVEDYTNKYFFETKLFKEKIRNMLFVTRDCNKILDMYYFDEKIWERNKKTFNNEWKMCLEELNSINDDDKIYNKLGIRQTNDGNPYLVFNQEFLQHLIGLKSIIKASNYPTEKYKPHLFNETMRFHEGELYYDDRIDKNPLTLCMLSSTPDIKFAKDIIDTNGTDSLFFSDLDSLHETHEHQRLQAQIKSDHHNFIRRIKKKKVDFEERMDLTSTLF